MATLSAAPADLQLAPRTKPARAMTAVRAMLLGSSEHARPARRHYPPRRDAFLEEAAMAREMYRL